MSSHPRHHDLTDIELAFSSMSMALMRRNQSAGFDFGQDCERAVCRAAKSNDSGKPTDLAFEGGEVFVKADGPDQRVPFSDLLRRANLR
jgi:hypothetical protein